MTRIEIENLVKRFKFAPESISNEESELLYDACANYGQDLENIKNTIAIVNIVERFLKD